MQLTYLCALAVARWVTFAIFILFAVFLAIQMIRNGITVRNTIQALIILASAHALWEWKVYPEDEEFDIASIIAENARQRRDTPVD